MQTFLSLLAPALLPIRFSIPADASDLKAKVLGRLLLSQAYVDERINALPPAAVVLPSGSDRGNPEHQPTRPTRCFHLDSHRNASPVQWSWEARMG